MSNEAQLVNGSAKLEPKLWALEAQAARGQAGEVLPGELFSGSQSRRGGQLTACRRGEAWRIFL